MSSQSKNNELLALKVENAQLKNEISNYQLMLDNFPGGIFRYSEDGIVIDSNKRLIENSSSYRKKNIPILNNHLSTFLSKEAYAAVMAFDAELILGKKNHLKKAECVSTNLGIEHYITEKIRIKLSDKKHYFIGSSINITEIINFQKLLQENILELQTMNKEQKYFLVNLSHDLRTPCNGIYGCIEQLLEAETCPQKHQKLQDALQAMQNMLKILDQLLSYFKTKKQNLNLSQINSSKLLEETVLLLESSFKKAQLKFTIKNIDPKIPCFFISDKAIIQRILLNLLSNAIKFTPHDGSGFISIDTQYKKINGQNWLTIHIQDNGIGIDPKYYKKIFEPFSRLNNKNDYLGSGIGLAICEKIIRRHQGEIIVDSSLQIGTKITLRLPSQQTIDE